MNSLPALTISSTGIDLGGNPISNDGGRSGNLSMNGFKVTDL